MAWLGGLVTVLLPPFLVLVLEMPISSFLDRQVGDSPFRLASPSSRLMPEAPVPEIVEPRLLAHDSRGMVGQPVRLGLTLVGPAEGSIVMISGLVRGMTISNGRAVGADTWQVPATDLVTSWVGPPPDYVGVVQFVAELHLPGATIAHRQSISIEWIAAPPALPEQVPVAEGPVRLERVAIGATPPAIPLQDLHHAETAVNGGSSKNYAAARKKMRKRETRSRETGKTSIDRGALHEPLHADPF